jgi:hypothetical protein
MVFILNLNSLGSKLRGLVKCELRTIDFLAKFVVKAKLLAVSKVFSERMVKYHMLGLGILANKKFYYHQQSLEYINTKLREIVTVDPCQGFNAKSIEHTEANSRLILARDVRFITTFKFHTNNFAIG